MCICSIKDDLDFVRPEMDWFSSELFLLAYILFCSMLIICGILKGVDNRFRFDM